MLNKALTTAAAGAAAGAAGALYVEDVFSTWLYTGNTSSQTITNGIDLSGEGGLVWTKNRTGAASHALVDTERGGNNWFSSNNTGGQSSGTSFSFNSTGYTIGSNLGIVNDGDPATGGPYDYASWTFRKAPGFFDVVTYTGDGTTDRTISHSLGSTPGCIIVKSTNPSSGWMVKHRSHIGQGTLNSTSQFTGYAAPDVKGGNASTITVNDSANVNTLTYVAYIFAHDAGGFGDAGTENVISCGSYTGNDTSQTVSLGWEPQWLLVKRASGGTANWLQMDTMRGMPAATTGGKTLYPNLSNAEASAGYFQPRSTGFYLEGNSTDHNASGSTYIYIAIRRGPMKTPTDATEVFNVAFQTGSSTGTPSFISGFPVDAAFNADGLITAGLRPAQTRLVSKKRLFTNTTAAEGGNDYVLFDYMNGWNSQNKTTTNNVSWMFRRAPGFFDVVAYTGDGTTGRNISHNLGAAPELIILKSRNGAGTNWFVNGPFTTWSLGYPTGFLNLTDQIAGNTTTGIKNITSTTFEVNHPNTNTSNSSFNQYIAYLFATVSGVSKVGSYTGTGTTLNVDCGFTAGARLIIIKRTDSTGSWYVWDTARGIVSGNDPYVLINSDVAQTTTTDYIDPLSSGFQITSSAPAAINASGGTYIYLSIA